MTPALSDPPADAAPNAPPTEQDSDLSAFLSLLAATRSADEMIQWSLRSLQRRCDAPIVRLWLTDDTGQRLLLKGHLGLGVPFEGLSAEVLVTGSEIGAVVAQGRPCLMDGLRESAPADVRRWAQQHGVASFAAVPVALGLQRSGVLGLFSEQPTVVLPLPALIQWGQFLALGLKFHDSRRGEAEAAHLVQALLSWTPAAVVGLDARASVTLWNDAAERIFGWKADDVVGQPLRIVPDHRRGEFEEQFRYVLGGGGVARVETVRQRWDGTTVPVLCASAPRRDAAGNVIGTFEFFTDVSDRADALRCLHLQTRVTHMLAVSRTVDEAAAPLLHALCEFTGWSAAELWVVRDDPPALRRTAVWADSREHSRTLESRSPRCEIKSDEGLPGQVLSRRAVVYGPDGLSESNGGTGLRGQPWAGLGVPIRHGSDVLGVVTLFDPEGAEPHPRTRETLLSIADSVGEFLARVRSTTAAAETEAHLRQAQKMDTLGLLAGGITHDFNNVLSVLLSYSELATDELEPDHPVREMLAEIHNAGQRAAAMTRRLLSFSRRQAVLPAPLHLGRLVADLEKMLRRLLKSDITLETDVAADIPQVLADASQIEQVLLNLVVNARDAMPDGGRISVRTHQVTLRAAETRRHPEARPGPWVVLSVADTGCGMDEATQARMFEPFFTTKAAGRGTGMGLATVASIVKDSGGFVDVRSAPGCGTAMDVFLPPAREKLATISVDAGPVTVPGGTEAILLVEADDVIRNLVRRILEVRGYTVLEAADGAEALRMIDGRRAALPLVIADVQTPVMSGMEIAARLKTQSPTTKVLFLSGAPEDRPADYTGPTTDVLQKPFTSVGLAAKVRELLDRRAE